LTPRRGLAPFLAALGLLAIVVAGRSFFPSGLRAQYFFGPEFAGNPARTAVDSSFSALQLSRRWGFRPPDAFSAQWSGFVFADLDAVYTFTIVADDGSRLYVDQQAVVQEQGQGPGTRTGQIRLERGPHAVLLQYVQLGGPYQLEWRWSRDRGASVALPSWALSPRARGGAAILALRSLDLVWWLALAAAIVFGIRFCYLPSYGTARRAALSEVEAPRRRAHLGGAVAALGLFTALAAAETWPLATSPAHLSRNDNADTVLNEWTMSWVAHQAWRGPGELFDANIFHPERRTLAYSESLIVQSAMGAPLTWMGASPVLVYNLVLLAGFALTGLATAFVVTRWTGDWYAGGAAGILVAFNAHTLTRLPHMQAQHVEFLPLALWSLDALLRRPRWQSALSLALWFALQSLTSVHLLVFTAVALVTAALVRPEDWLGPRFRLVAPKIATAAALSALALLPFLLPYWRLQQQGLARSIDEVAFFSAKAGDYLTTPSRLYNALGLSFRGANSLFPGALALALACLACVSGVAFRDRRARMCLAFGVCGIVLSFGPIVPGYPELYSLVPLFQAIRASARFAYLGLFAVAILGGYGLAELRTRLSARPSLQRGVSAAALALLAAEPFAAPLIYEPFNGIPAIYGRPTSPSNAVVVDLPFPAPDATYRNAPYMLGSTVHFKPLLNGYSGFTPPSYYAHYAQFRSFPDAGSIQALQAAGVTHVFVHRDRLDAAAFEAIARVPELRQIDTEGTIVLYQLGAGPSR
jgi:hypothetical protein